jgi:hypothetical protein
VIAEALGESFNVNLPIFRDTPVLDMLNQTIEEGTDMLLTIIVKMELRKNKINGHLIFILNADSMRNLYKTLNSMLDNYS